jgi:hypothetical protein
LRIIVFDLKSTTPNEKTAEFSGFLLLKGLARLAGIEPTTLGFGGQYSIH